MATEAYCLASLAVFMMWRFARHRLVVAPWVLALFATFVSVDYALTEDRVAGQRLGIGLALYSAAAWAYFRFGPPDSTAPPTPDQPTEDTKQPKRNDGGRPEPARETADLLAVIRSRARQRIGAVALLNIALTAAALVAHLRPSGPGRLEGTPGSLGMRSGDTLTVISATPPAATPPDIAMTITLTVKSKTTGETATAPRAANGVYEIASFTINVQHGSFAYDTQRFAFLTAAGQIYPAEEGNSAQAGFTPPPASATLTAGQSLHGTLAFDVPRGGGEIEYLDGTRNPHPAWTTDR